MPAHPHSRKMVAIWLFSVCAAIWLMVAIGGITRLTGSGLSITDWRPITGIFPPVNEAHWQSEFDKYKGSPQHTISFPDMTLDEFKNIYWWEYIHRVWGRLIGFIVIIPLAIFLLKGWIEKSLAWKLALAVVLGGLQGALGWFMVQSGLIDRPWVSPYRLTAHLVLALLLFIYIWWLAWGVQGRPRPTLRHEKTLPYLRPALLILLIVLLLQICWGGFMAGTKAAMAYPTFPKIGGAWLPSNMLMMQPVWHNFFENAATLHFIHRWLGLAWTLAAAAIACIAWRRSSGWFSHCCCMLAVFALLQSGLGIITVLLSRGSIPVSWGVLHQLNAVHLLALITLLFWSLPQRDPQANA